MRWSGSCGGWTLGGSVRLGWLRLLPCRAPLPPPSARALQPMAAIWWMPVPGHEVSLPSGL